MELIQETLLTSYACIDASHSRLLRSTASECEARQVIESTLARIQQCQELLARGTAHLNGYFPHEPSQSGLLTPTGPKPVCSKSAGACRKREVLLEKFSDAVTMHSQTVSNMAALAGCKRSILFATAKELVAQTKHEMQSASEEFEAHIHGHGC